MGAFVVAYPWKAYIVTINLWEIALLKPQVSPAFLITYLWPNGYLWPQMT